MKFLKLTVLLFSINLSAQEVELERGGAFLKGTLIETQNRDKVVFIIAGSGPTDRNGNSAMGLTNNSLKMLAEGLAKNGIASLRYDKRGIAASKIDGAKESDVVFDDFVEDASAWVDFLIVEGYESVVIAGHSQGSLVGMLTASQNEKVVGFVSLAGIGKKFGEVLVDQIGAQLPALGVEAQILLDSINAGYDPKKINPFLVSVFRPSIFPFLRSYGKYNPSEEIRKLKIPVMIVNGTTDIQVGVDQVKLLSENTDFRIKIYEGMNHVLKAAPADRAQNIATYNQPDLPLFDGLVDDLVQFINTL